MSYRPMARRSSHHRMASRSVTTASQRGQSSTRSGSMQNSSAFVLARHQCASSTLPHSTGKPTSFFSPPLALFFLALGTTFLFPISSASSTPRRCYDAAARRRAKKSQRQQAQAAAVGGDGEDGERAPLCKVCGLECGSRNKLFQHIKANPTATPAVLKEPPARGKRRCCGFG